MLFPGEEDHQRQSFDRYRIVDSGRREVRDSAANCLDLEPATACSIANPASTPCIIGRARPLATFAGPSAFLSRSKIGFRQVTCRPSGR
jgi:hypothetical protein